MTREEYLQKAIEQFERTLFKPKGFKLPKVRVSVGLPYGRGSKKAIGQHWAPESSDDKLGSIFISPTINDGVQVLGTLVHEMVHAAVGNKVGHGPEFRKCALAVGLTGKMRSTTEGPELTAHIKKTVKSLGEYPHAKLNIAMRPVKKQAARMIKMECGACGFICRAAITKILEIGPPLCACNQEPLTVEIPGDE